MERYKVIRVFKDSGRKITIGRNFYEWEAQKHCQDPEASSATCTKYVGRRRTKLYGPWMDIYHPEKPVKK